MKLSLQGLARRFSASAWIPRQVDPRHQVDYLVMLFGEVVALLLHIVFLVVFVIYGVRPLAWFNLASVALFAAGVVFLYRTGRTLTVVVASALEVIAHQTLAVCLLGWDCGFQYYLLTVPAFVFMGRFPTLTVPLLISTLDGLAFAWLYFQGQFMYSPHWALPHMVCYGFNTLNLFSSAVLVAFFSMIYNHSARQHERELMEANTEAQRASQAKSQFLATVSHEFRTPMNAIIGFTSLALRRNSNDSPVRRDLLRIRGASQTLLSLINDILDFSKIEAGKLEIVTEPFDLHELADRMAEMFGPATAAKGIEFLLAVDPQVHRWVKGDPMRVQQVLTNLVSNAIKFTPEGEIVVRVGPSPGAPRLTEFSVTDTGIGIRRDQLEGLFEPFTQADGSVQRVFGGTGLGLSICRRLVHLMGGDLTAESRFGEGSTFRFTLPLGETAPGREAREREAVASLHVLVVEGNSSARAALVATLESFGFAVAEAAGAEQALELLGRPERRGVDLILIDRDLREGDGLQLAARLRRSQPSTRRLRVFLLNPIGREVQPSALEAAGIDRVLLKPITPSSLMDAILGVAEVTQAGPDAAQVQVLQGVRLLVVDDVALNRDLAREMLETVGAEVVTAPGGAEAVEAVAAGRFDAVLMDVNMPGMDGYQATRAIREAGVQDLPIIAMTAHALLGDRQRSLQAGMNDHVTKPINIDGLIATVSLWVRTEPAPPPAVEPLPTGGLHLDGVDVEDALGRIRGNESLLRRLLVSFRERYADAAERMRANLEQGDLEAAHNLAHEIKGAAGNVSARDLAAAAAALDLTPGSEPARTVFESELERLMQALATLDAPRSRTTPDEEAPPPALHELAERLRDHRLDAVAQAQSQRPWLEARMAPAQLEAFYQALDGLDFETALKALEALLA